MATVHVAQDLFLQNRPAPVLYAVKCCMLYFYILDVSPREIQINNVLPYCYILLIMLYIRIKLILYDLFGLHITCIMLKNVQLLCNLDVKYTQ